MYVFGTIIMPPHFQLFISSCLAKGDFPGYQLRNGDWKWTTKMPQPIENEQSIEKR
jgi:hypothetical protein